MLTSFARLCALSCLAVVVLVITPATHAHFKLNLNIRIIHVAHQSDGMDVYMRLPMPYLVASLLGPEQADGSRVPAPFTSNAIVDNELMHYVDVDMLLRDALPLGKLAAEGHTIEHDGRVLTPLVQGVRVYSGDNQPPFSSLEEAIKAFETNQAALDPAPFVGDSVVDVLLHYRPGQGIDKYRLSSSLNPELPGQQDTANLILDYRGQDTRVHRITGLIDEAVEIDRSAWAASKTFIVEGIKHILSGYDHLLFVACLVIAAVSLPSLAWRITGFTLGHSVTLSLGFFGFTPSAAWFIPLVETGIALSIIYAALNALSRTSQQPSGQLKAFVITALIGLLHGLGFAFILQEILGVTSANIWVSLLSFNVGVELGQLAVILLLWPIIAWVARYKSNWSNAVRWIVALPCIAIASVWSGQRAIAFLTQW